MNNGKQLACKHFLKFLANGCVVTGGEDMFTKEMDIGKTELMSMLQQARSGKTFKQPFEHIWSASASQKMGIANKFRKARVLVVSKSLVDFAPSNEAEAREVVAKYFNRPLDLPFTHCFIESLDEVTVGMGGHHNLSIAGFLISEEPDLSYDVSALCFTETLPGVPMIVNGKQFPMAIAIMANIIEHMNDTKNVRLGVEKTWIQGKGKVGKSFIRHTINQIVHIQPKTTKATVGFRREIDWSHRWEVRGHWRTVQGIGKNRTGEYCVNGMTWVKAHTKGPEDKEVVPKTRLFKPEQTVQP